MESPPRTRADKGKQRAEEHVSEATETTPLLGSSTQTPLVSLETSSSNNWRTISWRRTTRVFCITLGLTLLVFLFLALYSLGRLKQDARIEEMLRWELNTLDILNVSDSTFAAWIKANASVRLDYDYLNSWEVFILRSSFRALNTLEINSNSLIVRPFGIGNRSLAIMHLPPFQFTLPRSSQDSQLIEVMAYFKPTNDFEFAYHFLEHSWNQTYAHFEVSLPNVTMREVKGWLTYTLPSLNIPMHYSLPNIPFLPPPPTPLLSAIATVVQLANLQVFTDRSVAAQAVLPNPLPYFKLPEFTLELTPELTGMVYLPPISKEESLDSPRLLPIVSGSPSTIILSSTSREIVVPVHGGIIPIPQTPDAEAQVSMFLSTYLTGNVSPIIIFLFNRYLPFDFPGPNPKPKILQDIRLSNMRIMPKTADKSTVSGSIDAVVALPDDIHLNLNVQRIAVDLLVYDGEVSDPEFRLNHTLPYLPIHIPIRLPHPKLRFPHLPPHRHSSPRPAPPLHPLPVPLPSNAFARIRPDVWLNATSSPVESDGIGRGSQFEVSASFSGVPLEILPGKDNAFRSFITKVIFQKEALAGFQGFAGVGVVVPGLVQDAFNISKDESGLIELTDLPFQGSVSISKGNF